MYYAIKVWDKDDKVIDEEITPILEELPEKFKMLDNKYPKALGVTLRALYVLETYCGLDRETIREAAEIGDLEKIQALFDAEEEEFL